MKQDRREWLLGQEHVEAVYWYTTFSKSLPLLVVPGSEMPSFSRVPKDIPGWIILTTDDIAFGSDVFAVNFLHFKYRSAHLHGNALLDELSLSVGDIRRELEGVIREVLIDIREHILLGRKPDKSVIRSFQNVLDRIRLATAEVYGLEPFTLAKLAEAVQSLSSKVEGDQSLLYEMIFVDEMCELGLLHKHLNALVGSIDRLSISQS